MRIKPLHLLLLLSVSISPCLSTSGAAQDAKERTEKESEQRRELRRKTHILVDEIATGALSLKLPENRAFMLAAAADLLWERDQKRARNLFWDALNTLQLTVNPNGTDSAANKSGKERAKSRANHLATFAMRRELLRRVSRRDPQLAMDIFRATQQQPLSEPLEAGYYVPDERELEQQIAAEAAARDPKRALQIARESLSKGITFQLHDLLFRLNERDGDLGSKFAVDIIDKLQTRNLATDLSGSRLAVDMVLMSRTPINVPAGEKLPYAEPRQLNLEPEKKRDLVQMIANAALGLSANGNLLYAVSEIKPEIEEFAPERLPLLEKKLAAFKQTLNKEQRGWDEYNSLIRSGSPEEMFAAARRGNDEQRHALQQQAIVLAIFRRRADALRELINTDIQDESQRKELIDALDTTQINYAADRGSTDELRKLLPRIRLKEERARAMSEISVLLEKKGDHHEAVKLLDEARTLVKLDLESESQSRALFALVAAYALVEPAKAFAIIEKTVDRANDQISRALLLDKIVKTGVIKKGEIVLHQSGVLPLDFVMFKYGNGMATLGIADFDRTKALTDRFSRNELRIVARFMLAQALLSSDKVAGINGENR